MKKIIFTSIIFLLCLVEKPAYAQWTIGREGSFTNVILSINLETNVVAMGSNYTLIAQIKNSSSNFVYVSDTETTCLCLTNNSGDVYESFPLLRSDFDNRAHKTADGIEAGTIHQWPLAFKIDKRIEGKNVISGTYTLVAIRNFSTADHKSHKLVSNPVEVQIR